MFFDTGVVKLTPAHDPNDFACGCRNKFPEVTIFAKDGTLNENGAEMSIGMKQHVARAEIERALEQMR